MPNTREKLRRF